MTYIKKVWVNNGSPPLSAENLQVIDDGIETLDTEKVDIAGDTMTSTLVIDPVTDVPALQIIPASDTATTKFMIQGRNAANNADKFTIDNAGNIVTVGTVDGADISAHAHTGADGTVVVNAATVTVVDSTSATTWPIIVDTVTGSLAAKTDAGLTYNASTANLATTTFTGALAGNASTATLAATSTVIDSTSATTWPTIVDTVTGSLAIKTDAGLTYNAETANLATTTFTGALAGNATTSTNTTGNAATVTVADAASATTTYPLLGTAVSGSLSPKTDTGLTYNADTNALTATTFVGAVTGAASLNALKAGDTMAGVLTQNGANLAGTAYQSQSFQNLLKNGDFESWSAGTSVAPDNWVAYTLSIARESTASNTKYGTYSMLLTSTGGVNDRIQNTALSGTSYTSSVGKTFTYGVWVKSSVAVNVNILEDGIGRTTSVSSGSGNWEVITVSKTVAGGGTGISAEIFMPASVSTAYIDGAILVEGSVVPAFSPRPLYDDGKTLTVDSANNLITTPKIAGGSATTQDLVLQTTTGVGEAGADMHFLVGNNGATEAVTILNSGNVGIGVASPRALLDVTSGTQNTIGDSPGIVTFTSAATIPSIGTLSLESNTEMDANIGSTLTFKARYIAANTQGAVFAAIKGIKESAVSGNLNGIMTFYVRTDGQDVNTASEKMRIVGSTGNVGIGTTAPATKLDVAGAIQVSSAVALSLGGYVRTFAEATGTPSGTTTYFDIAVDVPVGCKLLGAQLRVDTALTAGETWGAAYVTGSTTALAAAGTAVAQNTKISKMHVDEITTDTTKVRITRDAGNFTDAAGVIRAIVYFEQFTAMGNAA